MKAVDEKTLKEIDEKIKGIDRRIEETYGIEHNPFFGQD